MEELKLSCRRGQFDFEFDYVVETLLQELVGSKIASYRGRIKPEEIRGLIESEPEECELKLRLISPGYRIPKSVQVVVPELETVFGDSNAYLKKMSIYGYTARYLIQETVKEVSDLLNHHPEIEIFGKIAHQQRDVGFFSNVSKGYKYSGQIAAAKKLTNTLARLLDWVNYFFQAEYNGVLVNRYVTGKDYISAHSDDVTGLSPVSGVVSISYGQTRNFVIKKRQCKEPLYTTPLLSYDMVQMGGDFQKIYTHEVPKDKTTGTRYSLTFRQHKN
jgi:alkylated DNA repair dioxygenase AlkB